VLNLLKRSVPNDARCLVAITLHDFYSDESDLFIAGLAQGNCRVAAFSFFRYDPRLVFGDEFWYDWKMKKTKSMAKIILLRSCRLLTHEIGHLLGIDHCIYYGCLMNGSGHIEEDFSQPLFLCPVDLRKLSQLSEFDLIQRYERLLEFCTEQQFLNEGKVLEKRIDILKNDKKTIRTKKNKNLPEDDDEQKKKTKRQKKK
jgi:archaemetzincin